MIQTHLCYTVVTFNPKNGKKTIKRLLPLFLLVKAVLFELAMDIQIYPNPEGVMSMRRQRQLIVFDWRDPALHQAETLAVISRISGDAFLNVKIRFASFRHRKMQTGFFTAQLSANENSPHIRFRIVRSVYRFLLVFRASDQNFDFRIAFHQIDNAHDRIHICALCPQPDINPFSIH